MGARGWFASGSCGGGSVSGACAWGWKSLTIGVDILKSKLCNGEEKNCVMSMLTKDSFIHQISAGATIDAGSFYNKTRKMAHC
jgi:hypothetical protein